ncbi:hypothetical protein [Ezakiella coagulans]|uniref:hypothetical protein n=1 Tax=Ezakiella coagulans TaxID=46507 RepID=UPI002014C355|nr:hypothetical protein [Ezakiella coagulans]UQK61443.1 hypothetical protein M1R54_03870 [Ezakiella coagulans]
MDLIKLTCDFEVWKIANNLAEEFYPVDYPEERKADRERLIDFKDGLRNIKKSKHQLGRNLEELDKFLAYLNPKRRWEYSDLSMIDSLYMVEIRAEDLFDLMERGDIRFKKTDVYDIYRFLFEHEIYDREALVFLASVYEIALPQKIEWFEANDEYEFDDSDISKARKILKVEIKDVKKVVNDSNKKPKSVPKKVAPETKVTTVKKKSTAKSDSKESETVSVKKSDIKIKNKSKSDSKSTKAPTKKVATKKVATKKVATKKVATKKSETKTTSKKKKTDK